MTQSEQLVHGLSHERSLPPLQLTSRSSHRECFAFGQLYPQSYEKLAPALHSADLKYECLVESEGSVPKADITFGFLQTIQREIGVIAVPVADALLGVEPPFNVVPHLEINGTTYHSDTESSERSIVVKLEKFPDDREMSFSFAATRKIEPLLNANGTVGGVRVRRQRHLHGTIHLNAQWLRKNLYKLSVRVTNQSAVCRCDADYPERVAFYCFNSTHVIAHVMDGKLISSANGVGR